VRENFESYTIPKMEAELVDFHRHVSKSRRLLSFDTYTLGQLTSKFEKLHLPAYPPHVTELQSLDAIQVTFFFGEILNGMRSHVIHRISSKGICLLNSLSR
jgi:hypothetical protein